MGNYLNTCNGIKSVSIIKSTNNDFLSNNKIIIRLVLIGLDNSGKTSTALHLLKKPIDDLIPTMGFDSYLLDSPLINKNKESKVELIDLGGSEKIRKLWEDYFSSAHGLICLLDSADPTRFKELKDELEKILSNKNVQGKPLLILLNKMDLDEALDEAEICNAINIEHLVNVNKCPTKIEQCAVNKSTSISQKKKKVNLDSGIEQGFNWIVNYIFNNWDKLDEKVRSEIEQEEKMKKQKIDTMKEKYNRKKSENEDENANEGDLEKMENPFKPIKKLVEEIKKNEQSKNALKEDNSKSKVKKYEIVKDTKAKGRIKLNEKINEIKKKTVISKQTKVDDKNVEKQDFKSDLEIESKEEVLEKNLDENNSKENSDKENDKKKEHNQEEKLTDLDEKFNENLNKISGKNIEKNSVETKTNINKELNVTSNY